MFRKYKVIEIKPEQISVVPQKEMFELFTIWVEADLIWHTSSHGAYFNMSIDTPTHVATILTCLLTHQHTWRLF